MQMPLRVAEKTRVLQEEQDKLWSWREAPPPALQRLRSARIVAEQPGWAPLPPLGLLLLGSVTPGVTKPAWLRTGHRWPAQPGRSWLHHPSMGLAPAQRVKEGKLSVHASAQLPPPTQCLRMSDLSATGTSAQMARWTVGA